MGVTGIDSDDICCNNSSEAVHLNKATSITGKVVNFPAHQSAQLAA